MKKELTAHDKERYGRQMLVDGWSEDGQLKLKNAEVFISGVGGLGSPVSIYLAVAGVGKINVCDFDVPELSNLNRQILHHDARIGINKALSAKETLKILNPSIEIKEFPCKIEADNVHSLVGNSRIIIDCMDNFATRLILNECAIAKKIPLVYASVWGLSGYLSFINVPRTPCLSCIFPEAPPREAKFPVVGATPGVIGCLEALEVIKYLTGVGRNLENELLVWDGASVDFKKLPIRANKDCPVCGALRDKKA
ncbi:MAG: adenylyltransferase [Candidatus Omnitrophica bacterium CG11_big_fil_rev_8_21_14_0_20_42_13]|uniref:Adenylyltransferase n=1 Tax=Candidatus Ghiorseimicrobium undicola TaxID=1974746 RepID=A0A2H0LY14_9BACT|nr:MAG: adenylyltransferase [Candidatus Omnitrophica bacterium CG11_big_fil_rev_8_21_14_0_20_42_13]